MKFAIKTLLFINLLLQMTSSLRKCFDHEQNIMLTIVLLAFSVIGLIGLVIGNRFILIIFAACMTLVLIASITIYEINRSEQDPSKPKVPYYTSLHLDNPTIDSSERRGSDTSKLKSLVNKILNRNQPQKNSTKTKSKIKAYNPRNRTFLDGQQDAKRLLAKSAISPAIPFMAGQLLDDYSDEAQNVVHLQMSTATLPAMRSSFSDKMGNLKPKVDAPVGSITSSGPPKAQLEQIQDLDSDDPSGQVRSAQWIAYERHLYEKYLNIVSQSIDLVLHTILASWMALLLDEDSDECFGNKSASSQRRKSKSARTPKELPVYNYNGIRYSIRPDGGEAAARAAARRG